jgi:FlaG/FlaF family flagellin (archaellin)
MPNFCPSCGKPLPYQDAEICPSCGSQVQPRAAVAPKAPVAAETRIRNPLIAVALSFLCPGWGQWYNGRRWDGLKFFLVFVVFYLVIIASTIFMTDQALMVTALFAVLGLAALGIWLYGMYDAYRTAERINRGELPFTRKSRLFWLPVVGFILMILSVVLAAVIAAFIFGMAGATTGPGSYAHTYTVAATARQVGADTIYVTWEGGQDNDKVTSYSVLITSSTGKTGYEGDLAPNIGEMNQFEGGTSGNDHVVVMASFTDGSQQLVLDTYV